MKTPTLLAAAATFLAFASAAPAPEVEARSYQGRYPNCPGRLSGKVLLPTLTLPVSKVNPNKNFGDSKDFVLFTPNDLATVINFDIPQDAAGKTCTLYFSIPTLDQLGYAGYYFNGPGNFRFVDFASSASASATYNTLPAIYRDLGTINLQPGHFYNLSSIPCPVGPISGATGSLDSTLIYYEENSGRCPMGLFTTYQ